MLVISGFALHAFDIFAGSPSPGARKLRPERYSAMAILSFVASELIAPWLFSFATMASGASLRSAPACGPALPGTLA